MTVRTGVLYDPDASYDVVTSDIVYLADGELQLPARMYLPQGAEPFPAVVDVHGGAWAAQSHVFNAASHEALARSGVVVMAIDFRSSNLAPHPAAMQDINYAVRWLKAHASQYNATSEKLGIVGWSSGGHQVMLGAMRPEAYPGIPLAEAADLDARVAYVVLGWPVLDPIARYRLAQAAGNEALMRNHLVYFGDEATQERENPVLMLERGEQVELPPVLIVQGSADEALPRMLAERFVELYSLAGGVVELGKYPGAPHGFMREPGPNTDRAQEQIRHFIARQLQSEGEERA
jgi:acetyl esterase/lipase